MLPVEWLLKKEERGESHGQGTGQALKRKAPVRGGDSGCRRDLFRLIKKQRLESR